MGFRTKFTEYGKKFEKGGKYEKYYALYEMVDTFLYHVNDKTKSAPHIRDHLDMKRMMTYVVLATIPCLLVGVYNTGLQAALATGSDVFPDGWRGAIAGWFFNQ